MPLSFCSSVKLLISPSNVNKSLAGCSWLQTFPFRHLNISRHSLLARGVSAEKSADNLMGIPVCVIRCFSPDALIFRLCLPFLCLITLSLHVPTWVPPWDALHFLNLGNCFPSCVREVFCYSLFKHFLRPFLSLSSPSGTPMMQMLVHLMVSQRL